LAVHIGRRTAPSRAALEACPSPDTSLTFLTNEWGRPFSSHGFGDRFRKQVAAAGLSEHCVAHGLRKAASRIMAENNCTAHEIKSVSGYRTLKEVERYTDASITGASPRRRGPRSPPARVVSLSVAS
jgi:site-specific recombinase XerD